jgi:hypothetical protein
MKLRSMTKKATVVTVFLGVLFAGSVAFAYWTSSGTGTGFAKAGSAVDLTTSSTATTADLYPGGDGDLFIKINNPNPYPVLVTGITRTAAAITSDKGANCDGSTGVTMTNQTGLSITVAANGSTTTALDNVVHMSNASHTECQGALFTIPVDLAGRSNA